MTRRRGMSLLEVTVAGLLLGTLLTVCLQLLGATAVRRRAIQERQIGTIEAANVMERLAVRPWEELDPDALDDVQLSREAGQSLREGRLEIDVSPVDDPVEAKRLTVLVEWQNASGEPQPPIRLVAWRYRLQGGGAMRTQDTTTVGTAP